MRGWRWWFASYGIVPLTTIGVSFLVAFAWIGGGGGGGGSHAFLLIEIPFLIVGFAVAYAIAGVFFGIPIAAIVCVLIYDAWQWIDAGY